jgi:hypothetical protein
VDEVLKGSNLRDGSIINVQRIGGFVKYPDERTESNPCRRREREAIYRNSKETCGMDSTVR